MSRVLFITIFFLSISLRLFAQEPKLMLPIGHSLGVATAVFSPDGKRMVTSSLDNTVKIWEVNTGLLLGDLRGHTDTVLAANYSPDGKIIVTAAEDGMIKIWDANTTVLLRDIKAHAGKIYMAEFSPDGKKIVTASEDRTAKVWEIASGKMLADLKGHSAPIWPAWFSPDGKKIITGSNDGVSKIWDASSGTLLVDLLGHSLEIGSAEFSPDGKKIITSSMDSTVKIWDAATGKILIDLSEHIDYVRFAHFSPDGKKFLSGSNDGKVKIWDVSTGKKLFELLGKKKEPGDNFADYYPDVVMAAHFSPDGKKILTAYMDSTAKIWDAATGKLILNIKKDYEYVNSASFSPDGKKFVLALAYAHAAVYDEATGKLLSDLKGKVNQIQAPQLSKDGKKILVSAISGPAKLLDAATGELIAKFQCDGNDARYIFASFSPDEKKILVTNYLANTLRVYDAITGALLLELKGHTKEAFGHFSSDSKRITTYASDSTCKIWDATNGKIIYTIKGNKPESFFGQSFSTADGKKIIGCSQQDGTISIWNTETRKLEKEIKAHEKFITAFNLSPDKKKILTTSEDSTAKIWEVETGMLLYTIKEPGRRIRSGRFSPDGSRIFLTLTEVIKGTIITKIWDTETGNYITELNQGGSNPDYAVWFTEDGKKAYSGMSDGSLKIWDAETGKLIKNFKGLKETVNTEIRQFTPDGKQIISTSDEGDIKFYDAETGAFVRELKGHNFKISNIQFSPDDKKIYTSCWDNTIKVWDAESRKELLTFLTIGDDDYLMLDKDNHFDGTEAARKLLYFTCGTEVIELDQVKDQLWVPNLAERIMNGETINAAKLSDLNICNLTPIVETIDQTALQYRFRITPRLGGLGATIVNVNGIEVKRYTPQQLIQQKGNYQLAIDKKELQKFFVSGKENSIVVKSLTAKNSISSRSVSINEKANEKSVALPNLYAVVVGVSDYKGEELDLNFAAKDAADMANAVDASAKKMLNTDGNEHVFMYKIHTGVGRDKFPEKNSIKQVFTEIAGKAQPNDILLVFFAGHGVMESENNKFYFLTADASNTTVSGALKDVGISTDELTEWIRPQIMKAQKRILIFDACNSGQAIKEMISIGQKGQNFLAARGDDKSKQIKAVEKLNERSGLFILSASASDQKAYEMGKYNQGALTYSLLKAIKEEPDILEDRKYLNISRWFNAAEKTVGELSRETGARQQPQIVSTTNFNIGVVDEEVRDKIVLPFEKPMFTRSEFRNTETTIDNLKLRSLVDKELIDLSEQANASIMYSPEYEGQNVYQLSGSYTVSGNDIAVTIVITQGGTEIKTKFEVKGAADQLNNLSKSIIAKVKEWLIKK